MINIVYSEKTTDTNEDVLPSPDGAFAALEGSDFGYLFRLFDADPSAGGCSFLLCGSRRPLFGLEFEL